MGFTVQCTLSTVQCALSTVHCALHTVQCTMYGGKRDQEVENDQRFGSLGHQEWSRGNILTWNVWTIWENLWTIIRKCFNNIEKMFGKCENVWIIVRKCLNNCEKFFEQLWNKWVKSGSFYFSVKFFKSGLNNLRYVYSFH